MEMAFLVLLYSTGAVIIPEKYEISQCEYIAKDNFGAKCIPAPKGDYCKFHIMNEAINLGDHSILTSTKECD